VSTFSQNDSARLFAKFPLPPLHIVLSKLPLIKPPLGRGVFCTSSIYWVSPFSLPSYFFGYLRVPLHNPLCIFLSVHVVRNRRNAPLFLPFPGWPRRRAKLSLRGPSVLNFCHLCSGNPSAPRGESIRAQEFPHFLSHARSLCNSSLKVSSILTLRLWLPQTLPLLLRNKVPCLNVSLCFFPYQTPHCPFFLATLLKRWQ